jgi:hypothetical protein
MQDIWYGWDATRMEEVNSAMHAARHLQGADFIQEVYGILMDEEDEVLGLVVEATRGRPVQGLKDLIPVSHAVSELERRHCVFRGFLLGCLLITDGKARFSDLRHIIVFPPGEQAGFDQQKEYDHWATLDWMWQMLEEGETMYTHFNFMVSQPAILLSSYAPERPFSPLATHFIFFLRGLSELIGEDDDEYDSIDRPMLAGSQSDIIQRLRVYEDLTGASLELYDDSARLRLRALKHALRTPFQTSWSGRIPVQSTQRRARRYATTAPYRRSFQSRPTPSQMGYTYDSDCTSESGHSRFEEIL